MTPVSSRALACAAALAGLLGIGVPAPAQASAPKDAAVRRFALVVGANDGGSERARLRYARSDATALSGVLGDIGGVAAADRFALDDPDATALAGTFAVLAQSIALAQGAGRQTQLVFYYSGHSDEQGLLLGGELMDYETLRKLIASVPADVNVVILDSCASGAFTRLKGGSKRPGFLTHTSTRIKGHAYLTSSSADEASQESDRVGGSFFTHYFVTGLRGAADLDGDKQVTLGEAYQFAYDETLARTQSTQGGAQHASYDINLAGSGDLVMTDLRETTARLEIAREVGGRIYARDSSGYLAAELYKTKEAAPVMLALEPDSYEITVADGETLWKANLTVREGKSAVLGAHGLTVSRSEATVTRGATDEPGIVWAPRGTAERESAGPEAPTAGTGEPAMPDTTPEEPADPDATTTIPFNLGLFPPADLNARARGKEVLNNFSAELLWSRTTKVHGTQLVLGVNVTDEDMRGVQAAGIGNVAAGYSSGIQAAGLFNWAQRHRGLQLGLVNTGSRIHGLQIGLINTAEEADASLGVITYTKKGGVFGNLWTADTAILIAGVRFRAKHTYTFLAVGGHPVPGDPSVQYGLGFGGHIRLPGKAYLELDTALYGAHGNFSTFDPRAPNLLSTTRLMVGYRPAERFALFLGPSFNLLIEGDPESAGDRPGYEYGLLRVQAGAVGLRAWPGFAAGLEF